jgi:hypothetical protein
MQESPPDSGDCQVRSRHAYEETECGACAIIRTGCESIGRCPAFTRQDARAAKGREPRGSCSGCLPGWGRTRCAISRRRCHDSGSWSRCDVPENARQVRGIGGRRAERRRAVTGWDSGKVWRSRQPSQGRRLPKRRPAYWETLARHSLRGSAVAWVWGNRMIMRGTSRLGRMNRARSRSCGRPGSG